VQQSTFFIVAAEQSSSVYTRRLSRRRTGDRSSNPFADRRRYAKISFISRAWTTIITVRFIAYGSQWLDWHKTENDQIAGVLKQ